MQAVEGEVQDKELPGSLNSQERDISQDTSIRIRPWIKLTQRAMVRSQEDKHRPEVCQAQWVEQSKKYKAGSETVQQMTKAS